MYAITDLQVHQAKPAQLAAVPRGHWVPRNELHRVRDVGYDEDRSQIRTGNGPRVVAVLRKAAISALRLAGLTNIAAANRHHARDGRGWPAWVSSSGRRPARRGWRASRGWRRSRACQAVPARVRMSARTASAVGSPS